MNLEELRAKLFNDEIDRLEKKIKESLVGYVPKQQSKVVVNMRAGIYPPDYERRCREQDWED